MACVLFADDDADMRTLASQLLGRRGYHVVTAADGAEAITLLCEIDPQLVITDLNMPTQDGYAVCRAVRLSLALRHIPLVLITALPYDDRRVIQVIAETRAIVMAKTDIVRLADVADQLVPSAA